MSGYVTQEQLDDFKASVMEIHEQTRKLMNSQALALDKKIQLIAKQLEAFISRRPDPTIIRDAWIRQIPKIREELRQLSMLVGQLKSNMDKRKGTQ